MDSTSFKMRQLKSALQSQRKGIDLSLLVIILILVIFGLIMVYDASAIHALKDFKDSLYYARQQLVWVFLGIILMTFFSKFDYKRLKQFALPLVVISSLMLLAVFIPGLGESGGGAHRWLRFGPITIQPAEIIKLTGVIFLSAIFEKKIRYLPFLIFVIGVSFVIAVLQRDLGSTIVFVSTMS